MIGKLVSPKTLCKIELFLILLCSLDSNEGRDANKFRGKRSLLSFLSWLDYIDQLIRESHQVSLVFH